MALKSVGKIHFTKNCSDRPQVIPVHYTGLTLNTTAIFSWNRNLIRRILLTSVIIIVLLLLTDRTQDAIMSVIVVQFIHVWTLTVEINWIGEGRGNYRFFFPPGYCLHCYRYPER